MHGGGVHWGFFDQDVMKKTFHWVLSTLLFPCVPWRVRCPWPTALFNTKTNYVEPTSGWYNLQLLQDSLEKDEFKWHFGWLDDLATNRQNNQMKPTVSRLNWYMYLHDNFDFELELWVPFIDDYVYATVLSNKSLKRVWLNPIWQCPGK